MKQIRNISVVFLGLFAAVFAVYWFNLDTRLVKALEKPMMRHYDNLTRDHRL